MKKSYKLGRVTYYFKENRMPFVILKKIYEHFRLLKNAYDSETRIFLEKM
jgi:hypothetical protein